ncbi:SMI1/KNR4 family protein [Methylomonas methanica]|uniref:Cell wall assembly/cell proliferation coordinating protein, KNR4-like protein n=1 Tax=Methylomonas methanica (strain DSM 25384 / MC09) TaxID=857087 RepID=F9ZWQ8_METMM|nr:SMI1/KNR4 family protein [Methylomonas methanica]AEG00905.1 Cell wall assembly/cell proliferation coordinating protein, KNR4-like protein [Methylomonas methanica MC09]
MIFTNQDKRVLESDVTAIETELRIRFPEPLRKLFVENNGGEPEPYVYQDDSLSTVVSETLPLISDSGRGTAVDTYNNLVVKKRLVGSNFFPFAVDAGGDYFFVDCSSDNADVYFFRSDTYPDLSKGLMNLKIGLDAFWLVLKLEERA